jgi:hypothetical protein
MILKGLPLIANFSGIPALLDANLLLLFWCAGFDRRLVGSFKRLNCFCEQDVELLQAVLTLFPTLRTTPHVLTEVSNLANSLPQWRKEAWVEYFARSVEALPEQWIQAREIATDPIFRLGITDACLCRLASSHVILTIDFPLSNYLESRNLNVINFDRLRGMQWQ